jgi:hypothetical protein
VTRIIRPPALRDDLADSLAVLIEVHTLPRVERALADLRRQLEHDPDTALSDRRRVRPRVSPHRNPLQGNGTRPETNGSSLRSEGR